MYGEWTNRSNALPREGQQIEFVLDCRSVAMQGTYTHQSFRSRWAQYAIVRVRSWRNLIKECDPAAPARNPAARVVFSTSRLEASHHPLPAGGVADAA